MSKNTESKKKSVGTHTVQRIVCNPAIAYGWRMRGPGCRNCIYHQLPSSATCGFDKSFQFQTFKDSWCHNYKEKE